MIRRIVGFHQDAESHWVADLECGHSQHVRHDPPWQNRPWVLAESTRAEHLGTPLNCVLCDATNSSDDNRSPSAGQADADKPNAYDDARMQGLCHDGAVEVVRPRVESPPRK